jgi:hypothetical protein
VGELGKKSTAKTPSALRKSLFKRIERKRLENLFLSLSWRPWRFKNQDLNRQDAKDAKKRFYSREQNTKRRRGLKFSSPLLLYPLE